MRNYFAWTWGDALFVCINPYWESPVVVDADFYGGPKTSDKWLITHSDARYFWLKQTLENSTAKWKFVFAHATNGTGRGGATNYKLYEWGAYDKNGTTYSFNTKRHTPKWSSDWPKPIHNLMVDNNVTIFVHGHDHLYSREVVDGVVYLELPQPGDYEVDGTTPDNADAYPAPAIDYNNGGHVKVPVSPSSVHVDYVRT